MWDFLTSDVSVATVLAVGLVLLIVLVHSIRTRREVKRVMQHKYAELSMDTMLGEISKYRDKYYELNKEALLSGTDHEILEMVSYHMLALADRCNQDNWQIVMETEGEKGIVFSVLYVRQQLLAGNFFDLFLQSESRQFIKKAVYSLKTVGASLCARAVARGQEQLRTRYEKKGIEAMIKSGTLEVMEEDFRVADRLENTRKLCASYIRKNIDAICEN